MSDEYCGQRSLDGKHTCNMPQGHAETYHAEFTDRGVHAWGVGAAHLDRP